MNNLSEKGGADYLGVSPIYITPTKTDTAAARDLRHTIDKAGRA